MSDYRVLISCPLLQGSIAEYDDLLATRGVSYDVPEIDQQLDAAELESIIQAYDGVIAGDDEFTEAVFAAADRLQVVVKWGIGTDNIDFEAADHYGVTVTNTPGAFAPEVADVVIGYAIMLTRGLHLIDAEVRRGNWHSPRGTSLRGKTLGVVGVGNIGSATVRRARAHGMEVVGYDVEPIESSLKAETGIRRVGLGALFEEADVVSLHCPLTSETRGLVGQEELEAIGPDGYLINTARGAIVDEGALVRALESGTIAGAALDVFEEEPLPASSPLTELDTVVLGSHNAQNTTEAVEAVNERAVELLLEELAE